MEVNEKMDGEEKCICFSENSIFVDIRYLILGYRQLSSNDYRVEGSITQLIRLDARIATMLICLKYSEKRGRNRLKVYADPSISHENEAVNQLIGLVCKVMWLREHEKLRFPFGIAESNSEEDRIIKVLCRSG